MRSSTALPTAATTPQGSCPAMTGPLTLPSPKAADPPDARYGLRSLPHMPDALMATMTSCGPGVGSGNSASCSLRSPRKVTPRMAWRRAAYFAAASLSGSFTAGKVLNSIAQGSPFTICTLRI